MNTRRYEHLLLMIITACLVGMGSMWHNGSAVLTYILTLNHCWIDDLNAVASKIENVIALRSRVGVLVHPVYGSFHDNSTNGSSSTISEFDETCTRCWPNIRMKPCKILACYDKLFLR